MEPNHRYSEVSYWEERYSKEDSYEWLQQGYEETLDLLCSEIPDKKAKILILGCGNSNMSRDLWSRGFRDLLSTDISESCISRQAERHSDIGVKWSVLDMTKMSSLSSSSFDVVIEKATLDAFLAAERSPWSVSEETADNMDVALGEISRVLKADGGRFFSVTFSQPHFRVPLLSRPSYQWGDIKTRIIQTKKDSFPFYCFIAHRGLALDSPDLSGDAALISSGPTLESNDGHVSDSSHEDEASFLSKITDEISSEEEEGESSSQLERDQE